MEKEKLPEITISREAAGAGRQKGPLELSGSALRFQANLLKFQRDEIAATRSAAPCPARVPLRGGVRPRLGDESELARGPVKSRRETAANLKFKKTVSNPNFSKLESSFSQRETSVSEQARTQREMTSSEVNLLELKRDQKIKMSEKSECRAFTARPSDIYGKELIESYDDKPEDAKESSSPVSKKIVRTVSSNSALVTTPKVIGALLKTGEKVRFVYPEDDLHSPDTTDSCRPEKLEAKELAPFTPAANSTKSVARLSPDQTDSAYSSTASLPRVAFNCKIDAEKCPMGSLSSQSAASVSWYPSRLQVEEAKPVIEVHATKSASDSTVSGDVFNLIASHPLRETGDEESVFPQALGSEILTSPNCYPLAVINEEDLGSPSSLKTEALNSTKASQCEINTTASAISISSGQSLNRNLDYSSIEIRKPRRNFENIQTGEKRTNSGSSSILSSNSQQRKRLASVQQSVGKARTSFRRALAQTCGTKSMSGYSSCSSLVSDDGASTSSMGRDTGPSFQHGVSSGEHTPLSSAATPLEESQLCNIRALLRAGYSYIADACWGFWRSLGSLLSWLTSCVRSEES